MDPVTPAPYIPTQIQVEPPESKVQGKKILKLKAPQKPEFFNYKESINQLRELILSHDETLWSDSISVQIRDRGYKVSELDFKNDPSKIKTIIKEQLDFLAKNILVNEFDQTPLRDPVFLGFGEDAEFVGERKMLEEYLTLINAPLTVLKTHTFAAKILAWAKPIADWAYDQELAPTQFKLPGAVILHQEERPKQKIVIPFVDNPFPANLDPQMNRMLIEYLAKQKIDTYVQLISKGLHTQKDKRQTIEHLNAAKQISGMKDKVLATMTTKFNKLETQFDVFAVTANDAYNMLKETTNEKFKVYDKRFDEQSAQIQTMAAEVVEAKKETAVIAGQLNYTQAQLNHANAQIQHMSSRQGGGGFCAIL